MTDTDLAILFFGGIITALVILAIWALKLYLRNKRAGIKCDEITTTGADAESAWTDSDEFYMPGGLSYIHRRDEHPGEE